MNMRDYLTLYLYT